MVVNKRARAGKSKNKTRVFGVKLVKCPGVVLLLTKHLLKNMLIYIQLTHIIYEPAEGQLPLVACLGVVSA